MNAAGLKLRSQKLLHQAAVDHFQASVLERGLRVFVEDTEDVNAAVLQCGYKHKTRLFRVMMMLKTFRYHGARRSG